MAPVKKVNSKPQTPQKRSRGRPPKIKDEDSTPSTVPKTSVTSDIKLRRRDKIKTTERYSPELHEPTRRSRGRSAGASGSFPSTTSSGSQGYIFIDSDDETSLTGSKRRKVDPLGRKEVRSYVVDLKKDDSSNNMVITLPDGTTYKVDASPSLYGTSKKLVQAAGEDDSDDDIFKDDGAIDNDGDEDFRPNTPYKGRRCSARQAKQDLSGDSNRRIGLASNLRTPRQNKFRTGTDSSTTKLVITPKLVSPENVKSPRMSSTSVAKSRSPLINTSKSVALTATNTSFKQPPKRNYGSTAKFIDELPELSECTSEESESNYSKLPDKLVFINSDLPLQHSLMHPSDKKLYLFRQVISPVMSSYPCLLCPASKFVYKDEKELNVHYSTYHELHIDHMVAKFSDEIVFVCLPKSVISQMTDPGNATVVLNAACQYCGEQVKLATVEDMKNHYSVDHGKQIKLIEQEEILSMHNVLYCSLCDHHSGDFSTHHKHMKQEHKLHTFVCKCCAFTTQDPSRLRTHFRAKHMISNARMQNLQCAYCSGLIYGTERMNKHIMVTHCVQTAPNEFSCTACLEPCGKADELLSHSYKCQNLISGGTLKEGEDLNQLTPSVQSNKNDTKCFLCEKVFDSQKKCDLHLNHVHTKWALRSVVHDTFLMVKHPNGKTDLMPSNSQGSDGNLLKLGDLPSQKELEEIGAETHYGHYCFKCETVIKIYPLYYLHMYNVHKMGKIFECKVSSCKQTFKEAKGLDEHMKTTKHPQKSVIEDPLGAIACHFCNVYFADDKELQKHHLTEEHFNKITMLMDRSGNKPEPRNHKCKTCHSWFGLQDSFIYHLETESHRHECVYCGLHFALPSSRRTHIQSHHGEKADICEICNVKQGSKERLFAHLVEHNIVFECNRCMRKFYGREQLNAHMDTHGDSLECPWEGCKKPIMRSTLTTHIRQHRIESESKCTICGKGFSSKQVLQTHMEIHAKAESSAKAILQAVPHASYYNEKSPSSSASQDNHHTVSTSTALINTQQSASGISSIKQKASPSKSKTKSTKPLFTNSRTSNVMPPGLKIMCCSCNQLFSSQDELSNHKCILPVVTLAEAKTDTNEIHIDPSVLSNLISSPIVFTQSDKFQLPFNSNQHESIRDTTLGENLEEDPEKLVLDMTEQLSQVVQTEEAEKIKQKQLKKVEQLLSTQIQGNQKQNVPKKPTPPPSSGIQARARKTYSSLKSNQKNDSTLKEVFDSPSSVNNSAIIKTEESLDDGKSLISMISSDKTAEVPMDIGEFAGSSGDQLIMLQQADGQYVQICVPEGVDIEEAIRSLSFASNLTTDNFQTNDLLSNLACVPDPLGQSLQETVGAGELVGDGIEDQQVFYLPVNEDGTCAIDATALAMLAGNGEVPIIVTSSN